MKPGSVSVRSFQTCFPQTFSNQVDSVAKPEDFAVESVRSWWLPSQVTPSLLPLISQLFKDWFFRTLTFRRDGATRLVSGEVLSVAGLSEVDLSEVVPHGSTLFQTRYKLFLPKQDQPELFNLGEKPFISHLVEQT